MKSRMEMRQASVETARILHPFAARLGRNINRTLQLLKTSEEILASSVPAKEVASDDILRAVVVFLHATLEDSLRSLAILYLPVSAEDQLNLVPLVNTGTAGRPEKFFLGKLVAHRGKTVNQLLEESVAAHLARSTYNDTTEIASLLRGLGLDPSAVAKYFPALDQLIRRRHQIVHRADLSDENADRPDHVRAISRTDVETWIEAVKETTTTMMAHIIETELTARGYK